MPIEQLEENNGLIIPCINDDAFIDKKELEEKLSGKNFNDIYKTLLVKEGEIMEKEKEDLKNKIYEKTIMRKHLLRVYLKKFKVKENISVLKDEKLPQTRIKQDKLLAKIKVHRKKMEQIIEQKKEETKEDLKEKEEEKKEEKKEDNYWDDEEEKDWPQDDGIEIKEVNSKGEVINEEKEDKKMIEVEIPVVVEEKNINENKDNEEPKEKPKIVMRGKPKKLINHKLNALKNKIEKEEQDKKEENIINVEQKIEPKKEENIINIEQKIEPKKEDEDKKEEVKKEEPKKEEAPKKEEPKKEEKKNEIIEEKKDNNKINISKTELKNSNKLDNIGNDNNKIDNDINNKIKQSNTTVNKNKKVTQTKPAKKWWCDIF